MGGNLSTPLECIVKTFKKDLMETMELTPNKLKALFEVGGLLLV
jgi:hypothetical protein